MPRQTDNQLRLAAVDAACSACGHSLSGIRPIALKQADDGQSVEGLRPCPHCGEGNWRRAFGRSQSTAT